MFFRWFEPYGFMNCEHGKQASQTDSLNQMLFSLTFWGDYGGDILTRYHYSVLLERYPEWLRSVEAMHGQGLMLHWGVTNIPREIIEFVAYFNPQAAAFGDYPIWNEDGFSEWEWELGETEMSSGWWAQYNRAELIRTLEQITDWEGIENFVPETDTQDWWEVVRVASDLENDAPYWEGADSLIMPFDADKAIYHLVQKMIDPTIQIETLY